MVGVGGLKSFEDETFLNTAHVDEIQIWHQIQKLHCIHGSELYFNFANLHLIMYTQNVSNFDNEILHHILNKLDENYVYIFIL